MDQIEIYAQADVWHCNGMEWVNVFWIKSICSITRFIVLASTNFGISCPKYGQLEWIINLLKWNYNAINAPKIFVWNIIKIKIENSDSSCVVCCELRFQIAK